MRDSERDALRHSNDDLREQVDSLLEVVHKQQQDAARARETLAQATSSAWSRDRLVRVTVNAGGIVTDVHLVPDAFRNSRPETLGRSITEATHAAARTAQQATQEAVAPIVDATSGLPSLSEILPGAPDIGALIREMQSLIPDVPTGAAPPAPTPASAPARLTDDGEDDEDDALPHTWLR